MSSSNRSMLSQFINKRKETFDNFFNIYIRYQYLFFIFYLFVNLFIFLYKEAKELLFFVYLHRLLIRNLMNEYSTSKRNVCVCVSLIFRLGNEFKFIIDVKKKRRIIRWPIKSWSFLFLFFLLKNSMVLLFKKEKKRKRINDLTRLVRLLSPNSLQTLCAQVCQPFEYRCKQVSLCIYRRFISK